MNATQRIVVKKVREATVENYNYAINAANKLRAIGNDKNIRFKAPSTYNTFQSELGKKLITATRIEKLKPY